MSDKKTRGANHGERTKPHTTAGMIEQGAAPVKGYGVDLYAHGIKTVCVHKTGTNGGKPGKRGKIAGWSKSSRRRMREWMLTRYVPGAQVIGGNFTIPGPVMSPEREKGLWEWFCREVDRRGWSMIWRMEIQSRDALHWHAMMHLPPDSVDPSQNRYAVEELWHEGIRRMGPEHFDPPYPLKSGKGEVYGLMSDCTSRMAIPGALRRAAVAKDGRHELGAWLRYLQDHSSKAKQAQIAVGYGRHWGVVGRKRYSEGQAVEGFVLTAREYYRFLRAFQRLCTPTFKTDGKPFGRVLGSRIGRGRRGNAVWFSKPETVRRIVLWAMSNREGLK